MLKKLIYISLFISGCLLSPLYAQQVVSVLETDIFTEYELRNDKLSVFPPEDLLIPVINGSPGYEIISRDIVQTREILSEESARRYNIYSDDQPVFEVVNPGIARGKEVASLIIHFARYGEDHLDITRHARFRVYKDRRSGTTSVLRTKPAADHPFSSGQWYKIPVSQKGIYEIDRQYLEDLGVDPASVNPANIQLWGTDGYELPELNSEDRPSLQELPILLQDADGDGSFDAEDRFLFYGNSPHKEYRNGATGNFVHEIHPYSDSTYVFLTIGTEAGKRISTLNTGLNSTQTVTSFTDFIWKEEELTKSEDKQKSGRYWLGQTIPSSAENQMVSVFRDTIPGLDTNTPVLVSGRVYLRAQVRTSFNLLLNDQSFHQFSISSLGTDYVSYLRESARSSTFNRLPVSPAISGGILNMGLIMGNTDNGANAFVDYLQLEVRRTLTAENNRLFFFPPESINGTEATTFVLNGFSSAPVVMDVTDPQNPGLLEVNPNGNAFDLTHIADENSKIIAQSEFYTPHPARAISNQNLHGLATYPDYLIVTTPEFLSYAQELADYRLKDGLTPLVVTQEQILNEFSAGAADPTAIRDFIRHLWDVALADGQQLPKYLLLFGDTTYDTKNITTDSFTNYVLTYQTAESIHRINSYGSDDYFGLLDDSEGLMGFSERLDIGVGRIPAQTRSEAAIALDKIRRYENPANNGEWQNLFTFVGDDDFPNPIGNRDLHIENADGTVRRMDLDPIGGRARKIYLISYPEEITASGRQVPGATADFINTINSGTLIMNYSGHGNSQTLSDEEFYISDYVSRLNNRNKLPVFVTATCQFGRYDDINAQSGAEKLIFDEDGGVIASFTTTRVVYTSSDPSRLNYGLNIEISQNMLERDADGRPLTFGEIFYRTKNTRVGSESNSRKFILLGDPALRIALPDKPAQIDRINGVDLSSGDTTLTVKALDTVTLEGSVTDYGGSIVPGFNGEATITVFDAPRYVQIPTDRPWYTDPSRCELNSTNSNRCSYEVENNVLFKGKVNVEGGMFTSTFIIPKDISFSSDNARITVFAESAAETAGGSLTRVIFNGLNEMAVNDGRGPGMDVFINDDSFFNGSLVNDSPKLIVELADSSGINTTGTGVGHEITATIDTKPQQTFVLNDFYEGALNDYTRGRIEYPLEQIPEGNYTLKVRAWDVHNNPSEEEVFFEVADQQELVVDNIYNYPNPMNNRTLFTFEHNQQGNPLEVDIRIYTLSGKPVQHIKEYIPSTNSSSYASIPWNGRDRDNDRLGNGTYIYVLRVTTDTTEGRTSTEKIEKLVIIR